MREPAIARAGASIDIPQMNAAVSPPPKMSAVLVEYIKTYYNLDRL